MKFHTFTALTILDNCHLTVHIVLTILSTLCALLFSSSYCTVLPCPDLHYTALPCATLCSHVLYFSLIYCALLFSHLLCTVLCRGGFSGFAETSGYEPIELTLAAVADIHHSGGKRLCLLV
jgi:hypothetical protein